MQEVVEKEIIKWLVDGVISPIAYSSLVCLFWCVPNKGGITLVSHDRNIFSWCGLWPNWVFMDRKFNAYTEKDNFDMSFLDQILNRLVGKGWYCFIDGYSGYNQITIAPKDQ